MNQPIIICIAAGALVGAFFLSFDSSSDSDMPPVLEIEADGFLYTYHPLTGTEGLFHLQFDPDCMKNLSANFRHTTAILRASLARRLGVRDLNELRDRTAPLRRILEAHGYLK